MIQLWFLPINDVLMPITSYEEKIASKLPPLKAKEYVFSRGHIRNLLSSFLKIAALEIPLNSPPGEPPSLGNDLGNITFSHCKDALFVGWSHHNLGVDIERSDRVFDAKNISKIFFCEEEKKELNLLKGDALRFRTLQFWVIKEAAIKWQKGSICDDISNWEVNKNLKNAYHKSLKFEIFTNYFEYKSWSLGVAYDVHMTDLNLII